MFSAEAHATMSGPGNNQASGARSHESEDDSDRRDRDGKDRVDPKEPTRGGDKEEDGRGPPPPLPAPLLVTKGTTFVRILRRWRRTMTTMTPPLDRRAGGQ